MNLLQRIHAAAALLLATLLSSCFTPRGIEQDSHLQGALDGAQPLPYTSPLVGTISFVTPPSMDGVDAEHFALAKEFLGLTGVDIGFKQPIEEVLNTYRTELPKTPPEFFTDFLARLDVSHATHQLALAVMKIHPKDELKEIVAFLGSRAGKAFLKNRPELNQDVARLGMELARQVNARLVLELKRRNYMY